MRRAFLATQLRELTELLDRPSARTWSKTTPLSLAVFDATQLTTTLTVYLDVHWPFEVGRVVRHAHLIPRASIAHSGSAATDYAVVSLGIKRASKFDVLGRSYDSRSRELAAGIPLVLFGPILGDVEATIPKDAGVVVRVAFTGTLIPAIVGSSIETFFGYEGG